MSLWKDTMSPNWRTDELRTELDRAKARIRELEADRSRHNDRLLRLERQLRDLKSKVPS